MTDTTHTGLDNWIQHKRHCVLMSAFITSEDVCTCGLDEARRAHEAEAAPKEAAPQPSSASIELKERLERHKFKAHKAYNQFGNSDTVPWTQYHNALQAAYERGDLVVREDL